MIFSPARVGRYLRTVPALSWTALLAGGSSALTGVLILIGIEALPLAVLTAMAQLALYLMVAFGDGVTQLFPGARWWQRALFVLAAATQALRGVAFALDPGLYGDRGLTVVGAVGCAAALLAFAAASARQPRTTFATLLAIGVTFGLSGFTVAILHPQPPLAIGLLIIASVCEIAAAGAMAPRRRG